MRTQPEDLPMLAWQKAFDTFANELEQKDLDQWVTRLIGQTPPPPSTSTPNPSAKDRLTQWVNNKEIGARLAACRSQMKPFEQSDPGQNQLEHRLILLLAIHALMQFPDLVDTHNPLHCPDSVAQVQDYEVAIAIVAHLYYGQGCVLELRGGRWRVANMIRTDALEPMEADPARNGNIMRIEREVQSHIQRAQPGLVKPTSDMERFKSAHGGMPFVLDVQNVLVPDVRQLLNAQLKLQVVSVATQTEPQIQTVLEKVHAELLDLFSTAHLVHPTKKEEAMATQPVGTPAVIFQPIFGNVGAIAQGGSPHQTVTQTNNNGSPDKLNEFVTAMQAIHGMLKEDSKKQEIQDVIEIVQNKEDNPTARRSLTRMMAWLKGGAENTVLLADTIEAACKVKGHAAVAAAALPVFWPMVTSLFA